MDQVLVTCVQTDVLIPQASLCFVRLGGWLTDCKRSSTSNVCSSVKRQNGRGGGGGWGGWGENSPCHIWMGRELVASASQPDVTI